MSYFEKSVLSSTIIYTDFLQIAEAYVGQLGCSCAGIAFVFACRSAGGKIALGIVSITKVSRFSSQTLGPEFTKEVCRQTSFVNSGHYVFLKIHSV